MSFLSFLRRGDRLQLQLEFDAPPRTADELLARLRARGLTGVTRCRLTRNRAVMVSFSGSELRVHAGYLTAPPDVLDAIVRFIIGRTRAERREAQRTILAFSVPSAARPPSRRPERVLAVDVLLVGELEEWHRTYNARYFGGRLGAITIRVSPRMRSRLGQYTAMTPHGEAAEIALSRRHIRRHGWSEALHTLLHEMVHQWQAETGQPLDHGRVFRAKAVEVGIAPHARRELRGTATGRAVTPMWTMRAGRD